MTRYEPRQRTALDGKVWWCIWDNKEGEWSKLFYFGKYKTKRDALIGIKYYQKFIA